MTGDNDERRLRLLKVGGTPSTLCPGHAGHTGHTDLIIPTFAMWEQCSKMSCLLHGHQWLLSCPCGRLSVPYLGYSSGRPWGCRVPWTPRI